MRYILTAITLALLLLSCSEKRKTENNQAEDTKAKAMLAGVWVDADEGNVVFKIKGDSIFYPDSASQPVRFAVYPDTLVMYGNSVSKYKILTIAEHVLEFKTTNGDVVKVVKSDDPYDAEQFKTSSAVTLNQRMLIKRDTVVMQGDKKYHCYVQVNPTTYKVFRSSYNDEGIEVDHVYYDNIIHLSVFQGAQKIFSHDFKKADFSALVPQNMLSSAVLSDMLLDGIDANGIRYTTYLAIPESPSSYVVNVVVSYQGKYNLTIK